MVNLWSNADSKCPKYHLQVQQICTRSMQRPNNRLIPNRHKAEELVDDAVYFFTCELSLAEPQLRARSLIHRLNANIGYEYEYRWPSLSTLYTYSNAFDDLFFFGAMKAYVRIELTEDVKLQSAWATTEYDPIKGPPNVLIRICDRRDLYQDCNHRKNEVIGALLHELAHGFFFTYRCKGARCSTGMALLWTEGLSGHGPSWERLVKAIGKTMQRYHPELQGFRQALQDDINNSVWLEPGTCEVSGMAFEA